MRAPAPGEGVATNDPRSIRVAVAWELGGYLGHLQRCAAFAQAALDRGDEPLVLARDVSRTRDVSALASMPVLQAPVWLRNARRVRRAPDGLAEVLQLYGYRRVRELGALVDAWAALFRTVAADLVIVDYAPTAMLAARLAGIPAVPVGHGFSMPPAVSPMPAFSHVEQPDTERLARNEARMLRLVNEVIGASGGRHVEALFELFRHPHEVFATVAELDHYPRRGSIEYFGEIAAETGGYRPVSSNSGPLLAVAYLKPEAPQTRAILDWLAEQRHESWVYCPGMGRKQQARYHDSAVRFSAEPLDLIHVARQSRFGVCHAGHGTVCRLLMAAKPLLLAPMQMEQVVTARRVEALGAGRSVTRDASDSDIREALGAVANHDRHADAASAFSRQYEGRGGQSAAANAYERVRTALPGTVSCTRKMHGA